ncbi:Cdc6/Cdc18 family protein [Natrononativus amylolyticus]|uniref:Cdc6/Cdc18 family protein n=1 Tax=Natrononativus amylolyticus TaxID=2963434 RepID=UPI0020CE2926|nr:Cdc6/Cdc18 family protein [Natrononativus amylolyticus]
MIADARVFQDTFLPDEIVHRNAELNRLSGIVQPVLEGNPAETACLFGPTGVGKTCCAQYALEQLRETTFDIETAYVNCWHNYNGYRVLYRLLEELNRTLDVHRQSTPKDELYDRLRQADTHPYVVILDEVDQLEDKDVLYDLYALPHVTMILIANDEQDLFSGLDDRLYSRLRGSECVKFDRYSDDELVSILESRVQRGLAEGAITREHLALIADAAAGDARVAIGVLRTAARQASYDGATELSRADIDAAIPEARSELRRKTLDQLIADQQLLYEIIDEHGEVAPGTLYEAYEHRCDGPKSRRMVRNYLSKMEHYNVIEADGEKRSRVYRVSEAAFGTTER